MGNDEHILNYQELVDDYIQVNDWRVKENSTVSYSVGGLILSNSGAVTANYWLSNIYDQEIANAQKLCNPFTRPFNAYRILCWLESETAYR